LEVDANDAEYFGKFEMAVAVEDHEETKQEDAGHFDDGAPGHAIVQIIEKINPVAADSEYDEGIQLPEVVPFGGYRGRYGMVVHGL
jgi:hypothetical protein